jgi:hypothetical protein
MAALDHFEGEDVIITFEKEYISGDSTNRELAIQNVEGKVLSWNLSGGSQPTEDVFAFGGKTFNTSKPREKFQVSFEVMINDSDFDFVQFGGASGSRIGAMQGKVVKSTDTTRRWRVMMFFQDSGSHVKSGTVVVPGKSDAIYRMMFMDVKSVTFDKEFSAEDYMKGTLTLEFSSSDENGYANFIQEECSGTTGGQLTSLTTTASSGLLLEARGYMDWNGTTAAWYVGTTASDVSNRYRTDS